MPDSRGFISVNVRIGDAARFDDIVARAEAPFAGETGLAIAGAMREGPGSTGAQFAGSVELGFNGSRTWPRTQPFGNRAAPARTLVRSGALESAWTGRGAGATTRIGAKNVAIGVDGQLFPQARVFQSTNGAVVRAKKKGARGLPAMYWFLGMQYGVWVSPWKLASEGFLIRPRAVSLNNAMLGRVQKIVIESLTGKPGKASPAPSVARAAA